LINFVSRFAQFHSPFEAGFEGTLAAAAGMNLSLNHNQGCAVCEKLLGDLLGAGG